MKFNKILLILSLLCIFTSPVFALQIDLSGTMSGSIITDVLYPPDSPPPFQQVWEDFEDLQFTGFLSGEIIDKLSSSNETVIQIDTAWLSIEGLGDILEGYEPIDLKKHWTEKCIIGADLELIILHNGDVSEGWTDIYTLATNHTNFITANRASNSFSTQAYFDIGPSTDVGTWIMGAPELEITVSTQPVPEPATMFLLGSGIFGFAVSRKKFKK